MLAITCVSAQRKPAFEVAAVKAAPREALTRQGLMCGFSPGGRFRGFGHVVWLVGCAYQIAPSRFEQEIVGIRSWMWTDLFEIDATSPPEHVPHSQAEGLLMLRTLLETRFKLAAHRETRNLPTYSLLVNRRDGRLGEGLQRTSADCAQWIENGRRGAPPSSKGIPCFRQAVSATAIKLSAVPLSRLADVLTSRVGRPVHDSTGLMGYFDVELNVGTDSTNQDGLVAASIFTAVQEQLGLKLESAREPIDVVVIDRIERPTEY